MNARLACIPCFVRQALNAARLSTPDPVIQARAMDGVLRVLQGISLDAPPALLSRRVYDAVRDATGVEDPFHQVKMDINRRASALVPDIRRRVVSSPDPLLTAIMAALAGNIIDFGVIHDFDLERDVETIMGSALAVDHYREFRTRLNPDCRLLYICDNAGEIALDCVLVERLRELCRVTASVKSGPIINDATMADAESVGLTALVPVIETGSDDVGVNWERSSDRFRRAFLEADIILAKGQGNLETLMDRREEIFFLLRLKCPEIASEIGRKMGESVFLRNRQRESR